MQTCSFGRGECPRQEGHEADELGDACFQGAGGWGLRKQEAGPLREEAGASRPWLA